MGARLGKAFYVRLNIAESKPNAPRPITAPQPVKAAGGIAVSREPAVAEGELRSPAPSRVPEANERPILVVRDDETVLEDTRPAEQLPIDRGPVDDPLSQLRTSLRARQVNLDESIRDGRFGAMVAAALMASFAFAAVVPWMLTRSTVDSAAAPIIVSPPVPPAEAEQAVRAQTVTNPAAAPVVVEPSPAARAAPANETKNSAQADKPSAVRNVQLRPGVSSAGDAPNRAALSPEEKLAVARGRQALENTGTRTAPPRAAPSRGGLSDEERAAVERGLRELEKAEQPKQ
jgi:hypothetical protein